MNVKSLALMCLCVWYGCGTGYAQNSDASIRKAVDDFMRIQIKGLPGKASYTIDSIQSGSLPQCSGFDVTMTAGAPSMGRSSVSVRCLAGASWTLLVPVRILVLGQYLVSTRSITPGQTLAAGDVSTQTGDLGELPAGTLNVPEQAIGQVARSGLPAGRPLRLDMLKAPTVIQQGQSVKIISRGPGFQVTNEGKALGPGVIGQVVQIRLTSGQVVSGIARSNGEVEINF